MDYWGVEAAADSLGLGRRQLSNLVGSGKLRVEMDGGRRHIPDSEVERLRVWRERCPDFYIIWGKGRPVWVNSALAASLVNFSQGHLVEMWHQGQLHGRRQGNTLELEVASLEAYYSQALAWGRPVRFHLGGPPDYLPGFKFTKPSITSEEVRLELRSDRRPV